ncbi:protein kinase domain-containing protein [Streptomyces sp. 2A115]|uniref:protein kinase domain-containing protein n=1 Tax=Streptomyces sp. 2A115 TaxID=3457439 RepID=UPI003FD1093B
MTGRYRLVESIGQGGMGRVWRGTDEMLDRQVAVKEMRIDGLDTEDTGTRRERTLREARATARIDHPNVVRVYDVVDEGERLWIVMELVDGRSLERVVGEDGPLSPRDTARIGLQLVAALGQVHAGGVLHRDIKPGNVLVERRAGRIVLTDFGIAAIQDAEALTMVGMIVGSPDYMAPERVSGRPQGPPSDLWSLGATLCAALGGRSPFSRSTTLATLHAVLHEEPDIPSAAGELRDVLAALLAKDPSARPGAEELAAVLGPVADGGAEPETGAADTPPAPAPAPAQAPAPAPAPEGSVPDSPPDLENASSEAPPEGTPEIPSLGATPGHAFHAPGIQLERQDFAEPSEPPKPMARPEPPTEASNGLPSRQRPPMPPGELLGPAVPSGPRRSRRRAGIVAASGVVVAGAVTALVITALGGSPDDKDKAAPSSPSSSPSSTPSGATSVSPSPTVAGTVRPPTLPAGARTEAGVFMWVPPKGWTRQVNSGAEVHYTSPDGKQEIVGNATLARGDLMAQWKKKEENDTSKGLGYRRIRLEETTFRGAPAVVWEYEVTARGLPWHVRLLGFNTGGKSYQISTWYEPDIEDRALSVYERVRDSFTPL